jgi:hypothetical protein
MMETFEPIAFVENAITTNMMEHSLETLTPEIQSNEEDLNAPPAQSPYMEALGSAIDTPQERKRPTSLFERFTGVARQKPVAATALTPKKPEEKEADVLEIPAFLRRGGQ